MEKGQKDNTKHSVAGSGLQPLSDAEAKKISGGSFPGNVIDARPAGGGEPSEKPGLDLNERDKEFLRDLKEFEEEYNPQLGPKMFSPPVHVIGTKG